MQELRIAIGRLQLRKSPDQCGVFAGLLQHVPEKFLMTLFRIYNSALEDEEVPDCWRTTCFHMLPKKLCAMHASDFKPYSVSAQVFPLARVYSLWVPSVMPIAKEHMEAFKDGSTQIQFAQENPKKPGSKAWDRYEAYKRTTTIAQATENKAGWQDLTADFEERIPEDHAGDGCGYNTRFHQKASPGRNARP